MWEGVVPSGGSEGESVPGLPPTFWWLLTVGISWLVDVSLQALALSSQDVLLCVPFLFL